MRDVIMDQGLLGIVDRVFERLELLGELKAGCSSSTMATIWWKCPSARFRRLTTPGRACVMILPLHPPQAHAIFLSSRGDSKAA